MTDLISEEKKQKKRAHKNTPFEIMTAAIKFVQEEKVSVRKAADIFGLKRQTLHDNLNKQKKLPDGEIVKVNYVPRQIFSAEEETKIAIYIKVCIFCYLL